MTDSGPRKHLRTSVIGLCTAVVVALILLQAINLFSRYRETLGATEAHATDLSLILAEHMRNAVGAVDASLKQLVLHSTRVGGPSAPADSWLPILRTAMAGISHVRSMSVTDANGVIRHSTIPELIGQSRSDDVLFKRLSIDADAGIVADTPFRGTITNTIIIPFGRRLQGPDGVFQGIVVASVTPEVFRDFYKSVDVGTDGIIWVLHPTGLAFLREPPAANSAGNPETPAAIRAVIEGRDTGLQVAKIDSSGPTYVSAWHGLDQPPIVLAVSFSLPEALATWRRDAVLSIALTLLVGLALGAASLQLIRQLDARSAAERALAQREHELTEGQRVAGLAAARFILPDLVVFPSPQLAALFELPPDSAETTLDSLTERLIEPDRARFRESLDSCVAFGDRYQLEVRAKLAAGVERILWTEGVVENTLNTESKSILAIFQDVTEQRLAEERSNQSEQMAAIGRLTGGVAHDFNNLLTAIIGYTNLLQLRTDDEHPLRSYIEEIAKAGNRAASLTNQLLAFSRRQVLQPKVLNLNRIVAEMENLLRRMIGEDIELTTNLSPELGRVKADPGQIEQVLMNLAVNARDAMPHGGKLMIETSNVVFEESYAARTHLTVQPGRHVMLAVTDTGSGMDKQTLSHIFEPFFTTKPKGKGTGLGLSTAYGVVQQSGGNIWAYSEPGKGATFKIYLPSIEEYSAAAEPAALTIESLGGEETILLTEDEEAVRQLARKVLEDYGYRIIEAENAGDALRMYSQHRGTIHLLLTDVVMPGLSGTELARRICDMDPLIKVLYMSGYTDDAIVHHGVLDAEFPFLQKPFTPDALARKVREVLDARE